MRRLACLVAVLSCLAATVSQADDGYVCATQMVTGFSYDQDGDGWHPVQFAGERKYLVTRSPAKGTAWQVVQVGRADPVGFCKDDFPRGGVLTCRGFDEFKMNKVNLRFIHAYLVGYWTDRPGTRARANPSLFREGENSPFLEVGECSPM